MGRRGKRKGRKKEGRTLWVLQKYKGKTTLSRRTKKGAGKNTRNEKGKRMEGKTERRRENEC